MVKITLEFETIHGAMDALFKLGATFDAPQDLSVKRTTPKAYKPRVSGPSIMTPPNPDSGPELAEAQAVPADLTLGAARTALKDLYARTNAASATKVLQDFGATSISTVPVVKYAEFIKACNNAK